MLIFALVLGTATALLGWGYRDFTQASLDQQLNELELLSSSAGARITQLARYAERQVGALTRETDFREAVREASLDSTPDVLREVHEELLDVVEADPGFVSLQLYDVSGLGIAGLVRSGDSIVARVEEHEFMSLPEALELARRAPVGQSRVVGPVVHPAADGAPLLHLHVAAPVFDARGVRVGVVFGEYDIAGALAEIRGDLAEHFGSLHPSLALIDLYGNWAGDDLAAQLAGVGPGIHQLLDRTPSRSGSGWFDLGPGRQGLAASGLASGSPDPGRYSLVVFAVAEDLLLARARDTFLARFAASIFFAFGAILAALLFARSLVRPLEQLLEAVVRFGEGRPVGGLPAGRGDEVGRLGAAFAQMMGQVEQRNADLEQEIRRREQTEEALRHEAQRLEASEARYRQLYESVAAGVCVVSTDGQVLSANPAFVRLLGFASEAELRRVPALEELWVGPSSRADYLSRVRQEGELTGVELRLRRRDGRIVWVLENIRAVWNADGDVVAYESTSVDITERKQAEYAQLYSELRFRRLADSSMIGVAFGSIAGGSLTEANQYILRLLGYEQGDLPLPLGSLFSDDWREVVDRVRASGRLRQPLAPMEKTLRRQDGTLVPVLVNVTLIDPHRDEFVAAIVDRTAAVENLRQARELKEFYHFVLDSIPTRVAYIDVDERVRFFNRAYLEWYGTSNGDVEGRRLEDVIGPVRYAVAEPEIRRALAGESRRYEASVERDGRTAHVDIAYIPHRDETGAVTGFFSVVHDVTEARELESRLRQSQKLEALGQLTGGIAHDFNNLLSVVIGNLQLGERQAGAGSPAARTLAAALRAAMRGADLTRRLLSFSRRQPLDPHPLDLAEQVEAMREMLCRTLGDSVEIVTDMPDGLWPVETDAGQLENAMLNLAINARDAMNGSGVLMLRGANRVLAADDLETGESVEPGDYVSLAISDSGSGMSAEVRARAFEPFYTTKATGKGSGLGLAMVYGFVRQSNGLVRLSSVPGEGTTVELLLPRTHRAVLRRYGLASPDLSGGAETVLVVEDDADLRETSCRLLAAQGYRTLAAEDGPQALELLGRHPEVRLLFTDIVMPGGMNGPRLAAEAVRRRPELRVLVTTGFADARELNRSGLDPGLVLWKPYAAAELARRVRDALDTPRPDRLSTASGT